MLQTTQLAETVRSSLIPETKHTAGFRSTTTITRLGKSLRLDIEAKDIVALRAASNTFLRFLSVAIKTLDILSPFYTPDKLAPAQPTTGK